jgi:hypothetical protein
MTYEVKNLSAQQKAVIESLLQRELAEDETVQIAAIAPLSAPAWLENSWESAKRQGVDNLSDREIDAEIAAARKARRERSPMSSGQ